MSINSEIKFTERLKLAGTPAATITATIIASYTPIPPGRTAIRPAKLAIA